VKVAFRVENRGKEAKETTARIRLFDSKGAAAGSADVSQTVPAGGSAAFERTLSVSAPQLWSLTTPRLYRAEVELLAGGKSIDETSVPFGIRKIEAAAEHGLRINGEPVKLRGGCMHHDNGLLGSAAIDRAEERRVELMKAHGFNAIRTSHNPPSPAFLDACDRLGVVVIDEAFDCWERQKNPQDYHLYFNDWWKRDIEAMVLRDRNHPSVIFWSVGNEIPEKTQPRGRELSKEIPEYLRTLDQTHPITVGADGLRPTVDVQGRGMDPHFEYLDVAGYNYGETFYEPDHARNPKRVIVGTESYPRAAYKTWAPVEKLPYVIGDFVWTAMDYLGESSLGNAQVSAPQTGGRGAGNPGAPGGGAGAPGSASVAGPGSPGGVQGTGTPGGGTPAPGSAFGGFGGGGNQQPTSWFNAYCGDIDLIGQSKPQWLYRKVLWGLSKLEVAVQRPLPQGRTETVSAWGWSDELSSWSWPGADGKKLNVRVYSTGDRVQLLLNGKEVDSKALSPESEWKAEFEVTYSPGELKAVAFSKGTQIAEVAVKTVGKPAKLRLVADRPSIQRKRTDLSYVTLEVTDDRDQLVPDAALPVNFSISGAGELAATGTANPKDFESFRKPNLRTFHGRALAIVRPKMVAGQAIVSVQAAGFAPASAVIQIT
jgi:beta-galactosidase